MRSLLKAILVIMIAASVVLAAKAPPSKPAPKPPSNSKPAPKKPPAKKPVPKKPAKPAPLPKLVDLGAGWCQPCKMMKPVLEELRKEYKGRLDVVYIDINENEDAARKHKIRVIPTQIFFDIKGREFNRHEGYMSKQDILDVFKARGYDLKKK